MFPARMSGVSWRDRPGASFQLPFQIRANGLQLFGRGGFEAKDQRGLRVGGANESPAVIETDTNSVYRDTSRITRLELLEFVAFGCLAASTSRFRIVSTTWNFTSSGHSKRISGVTCVGGRSARREENGACAFNRISINRHEA